MQHKSTLYLLLFCLMLASCTSRRLVKKGNTYEEAGLYHLAYDSYVGALDHNPKNSKAHLGLLRAAVLYQKELEETIEQAYNNFDNETLVSHYLKLQKLESDCNKYQIPIEHNERYTQQFNEVKSRYLEESYASAQASIQNKNYTNALLLLEKVSKLNPNYKETQELILFSRCEPLYQQGIQSFNQKLYLTAYYKFKQIEKIDANFKDIKARENEAQYNGQMLMTFKNSRARDDLSQHLVDNLSIALMQGINKRQDPFIQLVDYTDYLERNLEQQNAMRQDINYKPTPLIPLRAKLSLTIDRVNYTVSPIIKQEYKGYLRTRDRKGTIHLKKIYYDERSQKTQLYIASTFEAVDPDAKQLLLSHKDEAYSTDEVHYIYYKGRRDVEIIPGEWVSQKTDFNPEVDQIDDRKATLREVENLLMARSTPLSAVDMAPTIERQLYKKIYRQVMRLKPQK